MNVNKSDFVLATPYTYLDFTYIYLKSVDQTLLNSLIIIWRTFSQKQ